MFGRQGQEGKREVSFLKEIKDLRSAMQSFGNT